MLKKELKQIKKNDILIEWEEQIKKVYRAGIKIDHLNSHHHIHMLPGFNDVVYVLAKKYNIKSVRVTKEKVGKKDSAGVFIKKLIYGLCYFIYVLFYMFLILFVADSSSFEIPGSDIACPAQLIIFRSAFPHFCANLYADMGGQTISYRP